MVDTRLLHAASPKEEKSEIKTEATPSKTTEKKPEPSSTPTVEILPTWKIACVIIGAFVFNLVVLLIFVKLIESDIQPEHQCLGLESPVKNSSIYDQDIPLTYEQFVKHDYGFNWRRHLRFSCDYNVRECEGHLDYKVPTVEVAYPPAVNRNKNNWDLFSFEKEKETKSFPALWVECIEDSDCKSRNKNYCNNNQCMNFEDLIIPCWFDLMCPVRDGIEHSCDVDRCLCDNYKGKGKACHVDV